MNKKIYIQMSAHGFAEYKKKFTDLMQALEVDFSKTAMGPGEMLAALSYMAGFEYGIRCLATRLNEMGEQEAIEEFTDIAEGGIR